MANLYRGPEDDECEETDSTQTLGEVVTDVFTVIPSFGGGSSSDDSECEEDE